MQGCSSKRQSLLLPSAERSAELGQEAGQAKSIGDF